MILVQWLSVSHICSHGVSHHIIYKMAARRYIHMHFHMHFVELKVSYFDSNFIEICSQRSNWWLGTEPVTKPLPEPILTTIIDMFVALEGGGGGGGGVNYWDYKYETTQIISSNLLIYWKNMLFL